MKIGILMDPIEDINTKKDSSFAMMLEAQKRDYEILYFTQSDLFLNNNQPFAKTSKLKINDNNTSWFKKLKTNIINLNELNVIFMRKDPPFDMEYIMDTYLLEIAERNGVLIVNRPQSLRDANEKFFTSYFPTITPKSCVSRNPEYLKKFITHTGNAIVKPMDGMGGNSIFKTTNKDTNLNVILETVTNNGTRTTMAQEFIPDISKGDKRILIIDGAPVPYCLARIPSAEDFRGNLAKGGTGIGQHLSKNDFEICKIVGPELKKRGILFAGIDVIGDKLTEVNVTSPTCIRELDSQFGLNIAGDLFDAIEKKLK